MQIRNTGRKVVLLAGAWLGCAGAWALPPQGEATVTRTESVQFRRSQVSTSDGAANLYQRLRAAAERVCADPHTGVNRAPVADPGRAACVREALDAAVRSVGQPTVSVIHAYGAQAPAVAATR